MNGKILVVDDEKNITLVVEAMLARAGFEPIVFNDSSKAMEFVESNSYVDAIVTDLYMPGPGGMDILEQCRKSRPQLPVVIITAFGTIEAAVSALKRGAFDFITKPFDQKDLLAIVKKAVDTFHQRQKEPISIVTGGAEDAVSAAQPGVAISSIIGTSPQMQEVFKVIAKIASSPSTVLVRGESGTGKELVAYEIHRNSSRATKPFIKINCAAIPATLIESELFGYEKGAFTGAVGSKPGRFELAHEGTLFLDEVAETSLEMQVKLLRAIQEQEFERVGGVNTIKVDVRLITATNKDLEAEVKAGRFREDLFYRLNVVPIVLPPLRDRKDDIDALVRFFLVQFREKLKKSINSISTEAMTALRVYSWPGNIRQLENALERMVLMGEGAELGLTDLPPEVLEHYRTVSGTSAASEEPGEGATFKEIIRKQTQTLERDLIEKALDETGGNVTRAAEKLGLSRKGLQLKIKELGLRREGDEA